MNKQEKLNSIFEQFSKSSEQFCEETGGIFCDFFSEYKGEEKPQNLRYRHAKIYYNSFVVKFTYTAHGALNVINSILSCSVSFDKNDDATEIPLPLVTDYCDKDIPYVMCIPFISNVKGMEQSFHCIGGVVKDLFNELKEISCDADAKEKLLNEYTEELKYIFDLNDTTVLAIHADYFISEYFTMRFVSTPFINILKGNNEKAIKQLKKTKKLTGYEKRLIGLLSSAEVQNTKDLSAVEVNLELYNDSGVQKFNVRDFITFFVSVIVLTIPLSAVYLGIYFLVVFFEGLGSVYLMGPLYNFPICIFFGFLTSVAVSYFTRFIFYKLVYKKDYERQCEMDFITNGGGSDKLMEAFVAIIVIFGIVGSLLMANWNLNFQDDGFEDNSKFLSLSGDYYSYSEIDHVYYKADRVNDFGDKLDFPSYVIVLDDGREIDLYEHGDIEDYENDLISLFNDKNVRIEK